MMPVLCVFDVLCLYSRTFLAGASSFYPRRWGQAALQSFVTRMDADYRRGARSPRAAPSEFCVMCRFVTTELVPLH